MDMGLLAIFGAHAYLESLERGEVEVNDSAVDKKAAESNTNEQECFNAQ